MSFEEALKFLDDLVFARTGKQLTPAEKIVVKAAWLDLDYKEVAAGNLPYTADYLQRNVGRQLWILLTGVLGSGEKVTKKRLREILERRITAANPCPLSYASTLTSTVASTSACIVEGQPPDVSTFYGREQELIQLEDLIADNRCLVIYGAVGVGKSALAGKLFTKISTETDSKFDYLYWKSVHYGPSLQGLLTELLKVLVHEQELPESTEDKTTLLIESLQAHRCLLVLDAAEAWLRRDRNISSNPYADQYVEYGVFFRRIAEEKHKSCILLISREPLKDMVRLQRSGRPSYSFKLEGLDLKAAKRILKAKGLIEEHRWEELIELYLGNPAAINLVASRVENFFGGSVVQFLKYKTALIFEIYREILSQQSQPRRLTYLEKQIMLYLVEKLIDIPIAANGSDLIAFSQLVDEMQSRTKNSISLSELMETVEDLKDLSLITVSKDKATKDLLLDLPILVKQYVLREKRVELLDADRQKERTRLLSAFNQLFNPHENSKNFAV